MTSPRQAVHHEPGPRASDQTGDQTGMTMVEVMVAMLLVGILMVGMNGLWVSVSNDIDALVLRQKAIFRLNGEMERLVGLYMHAPLTFMADDVADYATTGAPVVQASYIGTTPAANNPASLRVIYAANGNGGPAFMVDSAGTATDEFGEPVDVADANLDKIYARVFYWSTGITGSSDDRNLVWLDRTRNIVGQISWGVYEYDTATRSCYSIGTPCRHLTLYLDYPFRFIDQNSPRQEIPGSPVETITLQTIVTRRP